MTFLRSEICESGLRGDQQVHCWGPQANVCLACCEQRRCEEAAAAGAAERTVAMGRRTVAMGACTETVDVAQENDAG